MKVLVSFQPNRKATDFEGVRLRKTIKGALEMVGVEYTTSIVEKHDVVHLISPEDENKLNDAKENNVPVVDNPPVARAIYRMVEIGQQIPPELFKAVADESVIRSNFDLKI